MSVPNVNTIGIVGLRIGQVAGIASSGFGTYALMQSGQYGESVKDTEFRDGTGAFKNVNLTPEANTATFKYYAATNTLTVSASLVYPRAGTQFPVTQVASSSLISSTWTCLKVGFEEVLGTENATEITVEAKDWGF
jgi:hypothetical protein